MGTDSSTMSANEIKLFDKYPFDEVTVSDMALTDYIAVKTSDACYIPHSAGRWQKVKFKKAQCPLMERLTCLPHEARTQLRQEGQGCPHHPSHLRHHAPSHQREPTPDP